MEGPSIVIACEELSKFEGLKLVEVAGSSKQMDFTELTGRKFKEARSWGKHLLLIFEKKIQLRIHFLMWGSYRIDDPR